MPNSNIKTYHCICTTLVLATPYDLRELPTRRSPATDQALILPLAGDGILESRLHNVTSERNPVIIRREDGFEKRLLVKCERCQLLIGYQIEDTEPATDAIYLLPGGLSATEEMKRSGVASSQSSVPAAA